MFIVRSGETIVGRRGQARMTMSGCQALEEWCRQVVAASGVSLANMTSAWSDGKVRWHLGAVKLCPSFRFWGYTQPTQHGILRPLLVLCSNYAISNYPQSLSAQSLIISMTLARRSAPWSTPTGQTSSTGTPWRPTTPTSKWTLSPCW